MSIGDNIRNIRKNKGITQKNLAEKIGVKPSAISQFEHSDNVSTKTIEKIANALEVPIFHLIDGTIEEKIKVFRQTEEWKRSEQFEEGYQGIISFLEYLYNATIQEKFVDNIQLYEVVGENDSFLLTGDEVDYLVEYLEKMIPPVVHLLRHYETQSELIKSLKADNKEF